MPSIDGGDVGGLLAGWAMTFSGGSQDPTGLPIQNTGAVATATVVAVTVTAGSFANGNALGTAYLALWNGQPFTIGACYLQSGPQWGNVTAQPQVIPGLGTTQWILIISSQQLNDEVGVTWMPSQLIPYINNGIKEIVTLKPDAFASLVPYSLQPGIRQPLPISCVDLVDVTYNLVNGNYTSAVNGIPKDVMDRLLPDWPTWSPSSIVIFNIEDSNDSKNFYVFPPQPATGMGTVETLQTIMPAELTAADSGFPLDLSYVPIIINYVVSMALGEENSIQNAQQKSNLYYNKFLQGLGLKANVEKQQKQKDE
jgi:hypothetical protein